LNGDKHVKFLSTQLLLVAFENLCENLRPGTVNIKIALALKG